MHVTHLEIYEGGKFKSQIDSVEWIQQCTYRVDGELPLELEGVLGGGVVGGVGGVDDGRARRQLDRLLRRTHHRIRRLVHALGCKKNYTD